MADIKWDSREASPAALETIHKYFKSAFLDVNYFNSLASALAGLGFERDNSIALVNSCRDEVSRPISHFFDERYGHTFNLSGIAGIITAGELGFYAGTSHAPTKPNERAKFIFFGSTHTAVDEHVKVLQYPDSFYCREIDEKIYEFLMRSKQGAIWREGQKKEGNACGAIEAIKGEIAGGVVQTGEIRDTDVEYDILKKKIFAHHPGPNKSSTNFDITKIAIDVITTDLEKNIKSLKNLGNADYAVFTGVQIHAGVKGGTPGSHLDYIANVEAYAVIKGEKHPFKIDGKKFVLEK